MSIFSGAGGLDLGFARAGFNCTQAVDIDSNSVETHNNLLGHQSAVVGDVRRQHFPPRGSTELLLGGPPCQGFSVAGRMDPEDLRSRYVWDFLRVVDRLRPVGFVMENVKSLALNRRWAALRDDLIMESVRLGYSTQLLLLNAAHFGVPQARERMFLIGLRTTHAAIPLPTTMDRQPTAGEALTAMPSYGTPGNGTVCPARVTPAVTPVLRRSPFAGMLFNGSGRPVGLGRPAPTLPASMGGNRTPIIDQEELETGEENWVVGYHRHLISGGSPVKNVPSRLRRLTVEEAAALQGFPRHVHWAGEQSAQYRQIGNAVPPGLAFHVALAVRRALEGELVAPPPGWFEASQLVYHRA